MKDNIKSSLKEKEIFNKAIIHYKKNEYNQASKYFEKITKSNDEEYLTAQILLGNIAYDNGNEVLAEKYWSAVPNNSNDELYINSQNSLGALKLEQKKYNDAKKYWENITKNKGLNGYAIAQLNLGLLANIQNKYHDAKSYWNNISKNMSAELHSLAQLWLGILEYKNKNYALAKQNWENIPSSVFDTYLKSQMFLEILKKEHLVYMEDSKDVMKTAIVEFLENHYQIIDSSKYHPSIIRKVQAIQNEDTRNSLRSIFIWCQSLVNSLQISNKKSNFSCEEVAHYTQYSTALKLLDNTSSFFRLSTTYFMNDPSEGKAVSDLFNINNHIPLYEDMQSDYLAFASCFSLNHDSLNQFRLYGKSDNQENSGVSLVLDLDFFSEENIEHHGIEINHFIPQKDTSNLTENFPTLLDKRKKLPLYRCIYYDPISDTSSYNNIDDPAQRYFRISKRSKLSFYRSNNMNEYDKYCKNIDSIESNINTLISEIKKEIGNLAKLLSHADCYDEAIQHELKKVPNILNDILLPIRFLIKNAAFEEEEECRIIYITNLENNRIVSNPQQSWLYVDYDIPIKKYIQKIYLGKYAEKHRPFFEISLKDKSKVRSSKNPFS